MSQPIFKIFLVHGLREAYYQLSAEASQEFFAASTANNQAAGAKFLVFCNAYWSNEAYLSWGVEEYPDIQAVQKVAAGLEKIQQARYFDAETILGTWAEGFEAGSVTFPNPIFELWMVKNQANESWENLTPELRDHLFALNGELIQKYGGVNIVLCDANWSNEEFSYFGVTAWPSLEAEQAHTSDLAKIHWSRYIYGKKILGTRFE